MHILMIKSIIISYAIVTKINDRSFIYSLEIDEIYFLVAVATMLEDQYVPTTYTLDHHNL